VRLDDAAQLGPRPQLPGVERAVRALRVDEVADRVHLRAALSYI
jgi:hypothetical protein